MLNFSVQMELNPGKPRDFFVYDIRYSDWVPNSKYNTKKVLFYGLLEQK